MYICAPLSITTRFNCSNTNLGHLHEGLCSLSDIILFESDLHNHFNLDLNSSQRSEIAVTTWHKDLGLFLQWKPNLFWYVFMLISIWLVWDMPSCKHLLVFPFNLVAKVVPEARECYPSSHLASPRANWRVGKSKSQTTLCDIPGCGQICLIERERYYWPPWGLRIHISCVSLSVPVWGGSSSSSTSTLPLFMGLDAKDGQHYNQANNPLWLLNEAPRPRIDPRFQCRLARKPIKYPNYSGHTTHVYILHTYPIVSQKGHLLTLTHAPNLALSLVAWGVEFEIWWQWFCFWFRLNLNPNTLRGRGERKRSSSHSLQGWFMGFWHEWRNSETHIKPLERSLGFCSKQI